MHEKVVAAQAKNRNLPKVSIGMPVRNGGHLIRRALDSLLAQTFIEFELIISDNASTDGTQQICLEYASKDRRITYYRSDALISAGLNFNRLLELSSGRYFMWAAHDDKWGDSFVLHLMQALDSNPHAALAFCRFVNVDEEDRVTRTFKKDWNDVFSRPKFHQLIALTLTDELITQKANHIYGLMRLDALKEVGGMTMLEGVDYAGEDILTLVKLLIKWDFVIVNEVLFYYRARVHTLRRNDEPLPRYISQRISQRKSNHQGNLLLFFIRNHAYHENLRKLVTKNDLLLTHEKFLLWLALVFKEIWFPISFLPIAVLRELQIFK